MTTDDQLVEQINRVLEKYDAVKGTWHASNLVHGFRDTVAYNSLRAESVALVTYVYGRDHLQAVEFRNTICNETLKHLEAAEGILHGAIQSVRHGLLRDLRTQVLLDVKSDFVDAARTALADEAKDVAAVLACVVLEDSVKRLAVLNGLDGLTDKEFSVVVVGLFKSGAISKSTKGILLSHTDLRNSALHAQWDEVSSEAVQALMHFLPVFMEQHGV